jgi:hypothetical protein
MDVSCTSINRASVDWGVRSNPPSLTCVSVTNHLQHSPGARKSSGRNPPRHPPWRPAPRSGPLLSCVATVPL